MSKRKTGRMVEMNARKTDFTVRMSQNSTVLGSITPILKTGGNKSLQAKRFA